jgi:hypothetical protein
MEKQSSCYGISWYRHMLKNIIWGACCIWLLHKCSPEPA